ncbi:hypothetical protein DPMN_153079, partial [Dreissena polymorpha]
MPRPLGGHVFPPTGTIFEFIQDIIGTNRLTKFHDDRTINVASRVLTRKNAPPPWRPYIIGMNLQTKFHEDRTISHIKKNAPPAGGHVFKATKTIFLLIQHIIGTNLLTMFHKDRKINVASRVLTRKNAPPPWRPYIIGMNLLTKFHEDRTINVASRVKNAPPLGSHVFQANVTIFELIQDIIETNLLTKVHEDWTINSHIRKNAPALDSHVFQANTNLLTKFYEDWTINVASRVLTRLSFFNIRLFKCFHYIHIEKTAPLPGGHVFSPIWTIFELVRDINETNGVVVICELGTGDGLVVLSNHVIQLTGTIFELNSLIKETNVLTKFHENWAKIHVFSPIWTIFELVRDINKTNVLTNFHDDWQKLKTALPTGGHVFQQTGNTFKLNQHINKTSILT